MKYRARGSRGRRVGQIAETLTVSAWNLGKTYQRLIPAKGYRALFPQFNYSY
jgi:hypothetical protein